MRRAERFRRYGSADGIKKQSESSRTQLPGRDQAMLQCIPQFRVDAPVYGKMLRLERDTGALQRARERRRLGTVVIKERSVGVKKQPGVD